MENFTFSLWHILAYSNAKNLYFVHWLLSDMCFICFTRSFMTQKLSNAPKKEKNLANFKIDFFQKGWSKKFWIIAFLKLKYVPFKSMPFMDPGKFFFGKGVQEMHTFTKKIYSQVLWSKAGSVAYFRLCTACIRRHGFFQGGGETFLSTFLREGG